MFSVQLLGSDVCLCFEGFDQLVPLKTEMNYPLLLVPSFLYVVFLRFQQIDLFIVQIALDIAFVTSLLATLQPAFLGYLSF